MSVSPTASRRARARVGGGALVAAICLVSLNLRGPIAVVPPLASTIESELHLSGLAVGLVTALPVFCMGVFAPVAQRLAHRVGREAAVGLALISLLLGSLLRLGGAALIVLYVGTLLVGIGIAIIGTVLPGIIKEFFPSRPGLMTGVYVFAMTVGAVIAAAAAVPLAEALGSWQEAIASPVLLVAVGIVAWWPVVRRINDHDDPDVDPAPAGGLPWRSGTAWVVAAYLAAQSMLFYTALAWIPPSYIASGSGRQEAGLLLAGFTAAQLLAAIVAPALADRVRDRRGLLVPVVGLSVAGLAGLTFVPTVLPWLWMFVLGLGSGGGFALGLVHLVSYAHTPAASARLSAMAFLVSYSCATLGPSGFGALRDLTGGFVVPWTVLLALVLLQLAVVRVMRPDRMVEE